jgi:hypothetical protein
MKGKFYLFILLSRKIMQKKIQIIKTAQGNVLEKTTVYHVHKLIWDCRTACHEFYNLLISEEIKFRNKINKADKEKNQGASGQAKYYSRNKGRKKQKKYSEPKKYSTHNRGINSRKINVTFVNRTQVHMNTNITH